MISEETLPSPIETPALPGASDLDTDLLDRAVHDINRILVGKGIEMYHSVGEYILSTFFAGDILAFHSRSRGHATFRALSDREDLRLSHSALYNAVAVVEQRLRLPQELADTLPYTHQIRLLSLKDENAKIELARRAIDEDLSSRELALEVKRMREIEGTASRAGRPPLPAFVKAFGRLRGIREQLSSESIDAASLRSYSPDKARTLLGEVEESLRALQDAAEQLRQTLAENQVDIPSEEAQGPDSSSDGPSAEPVTDS